MSEANGTAKESFFCKFWNLDTVTLFPVALARLLKQGLRENGTAGASKLVSKVKDDGSWTPDPKISGHSHQCRFIVVCVMFSSSMVFAIAIFQCPCQFRNLGSTLGFHFGKLSDSTPPPPGPKMALPWDVRRFLASSFLGWIWIVWMLSYFFHSFADKNACNPNNLIWIRKRIMIMVLLKDDHSGVKSDYEDYATCRQKILWGSERDSLLRHAVSAS